MRAVLALNGGKNQLGDLTQETAGRIDGAMGFAVDEGITTVAMVGGDADSMRDYAIRHFPDGPEPIAENRSKDTIEGAHVVKVGLLLPYAFDEVDIFTDDFHAPRTDWSYRRVLGSGFRVTLHPIESHHLSAEQLRFMEYRERVQLAVARLKLLGIGPDDDDKREQRLAHFRFRGSDSAIARLLVKADGLTNINRDRL